MKFKMYEKYVKRILGFLFSGVGLIFLSPLLLVIAIVIKTDSKGPVFFKQERIGHQGKTFEIIKFRTMIQNAENIGDGISIKSDQDPRITKMGRFLRKTSLDELPQLINVLKGDMSLIGPRPPVESVPFEGYEKYPQWAKKRFNVRPGITGLAQVTNRNNTTWNNRIKLDVRYVEEIDFAIDMKIMIKTVFQVFKQNNIYG